MIRSKGEAGTGNVVEAVRHMRAIGGEIRRLQSLDPDELYSRAKELQAPIELVRYCAENGSLPVVMFTAGGIATPADAALMMQLGADGVFVGSGIFKSGDPSAPRAGDRRGDDALPRRRGRRRGLEGPRRADGRAHDGGARRAEELLAHARLVAVATIGVLALQGAFREHAPRSAAARRTRRSRCARRRTSSGVDALVIPGGESTTIDAARLVAACASRSSRGSTPACRRSARAPD